MCHLHFPSHSLEDAHQGTITTVATSANQKDSLLKRGQFRPPVFFVAAFSPAPYQRRFLHKGFGCNLAWQCISSAHLDKICGIIAAAHQACWTLPVLIPSKHAPELLNKGEDPGATYSSKAILWRSRDCKGRSCPLEKGKPLLVTWMQMLLWESLFSLK